MYLVITLSIVKVVCCYGLAPVPYGAPIWLFKEIRGKSELPFFIALLYSVKLKQEQVKIMAVLLKEVVFLGILASALTFPWKPNGKSKIAQCWFTISKLDRCVSLITLPWSGNLQKVLFILLRLFACDIFHPSWLLLQNSLRLKYVDLK